jgi:hypothetical protein
LTFYIIHFKESYVNHRTDIGKHGEIQQNGTKSYVMLDKDFVSEWVLICPAPCEQGLAEGRRSLGCGVRRFRNEIERKEANLQFSKGGRS